MNYDMSVSLASVRPMVMPETLTCQPVSVIVHVSVIISRTLTPPE